MNEVLRNVTELKIQGQHLILGNPLEDGKFSWFSHRVISDVLSEPNYFKSIHSSTALPNVNLRFTCTFWELINDINDHGSKANPRQLFRCFKNSSSVGGKQFLGAAKDEAVGRCGGSKAALLTGGALKEKTKYISLCMIKMYAYWHHATKAFPIQKAGRYTSDLQKALLLKDSQLLVGPVSFNTQYLDTHPLYF